MTDVSTKKVILALIPFFLAAGITLYRLISPLTQHNAQQILSQKRTALVNQRTARLIRESNEIKSRKLNKAEEKKELQASFYSAQKDYYKVSGSNYSIPYPSSSH